MDLSAATLAGSMVARAPCPVHPKRSPREPKGAQGHPKGAKVTPKEAKGSPRKPKDPKGRPMEGQRGLTKSFGNTPQTAPNEKVVFHGKVEFAL